MKKAQKFAAEGYINNIFTMQYPRTPTTIT